MPKLVISGADTVKLIRPQALIARAATALSAFVGRALKGPVNQATPIASFDDYQRIFGGLWQPSTMSYAIEQYFENGGHECIVVRVCNGGRAPTLRLPARDAALTLIGLSPGTREFLRAAVDYDGIASYDNDRFNLVIQRIRAPGSEFIEDQEIFRRLSVRPGAERGVADVLTESRLVRVLGEVPSRRPERSGAGAAVGYVFCNADGDDGDVLTNYDIIGDSLRATGLFALRGAEAFNFLCVPPLTRESDIGLPALLVALRLCRERQAMLLLDPPVAWRSAEAAIDNLRNWPFHSEDAVMFYPRVLAFDRLRGRYETFGSAAAAAGMLSRMGERHPVWCAAEAEETALRVGLRLAADVTDLDRIRLAHAGVNALPATRAGSRLPVGMRTLVPEAGVKSEWRYLAARRFALFVMTSIERGTRWVVFEHAGAALRARVQAQVSAFFESLDAEGAFVRHRSADNYFVICDERLNGEADVAEGKFQLLFGFAASRAGDFQTCLVTHRPGHSSVRVASVNRNALPPRS